MRMFLLQFRYGFLGVLLIVFSTGTNAETPTPNLPILLPAQTDSNLPAVPDDALRIGFDRYLSYREGWAFDSTIDWRQLPMEQSDALLLQLENVREQAFRSVARLEALRQQILAHGLSREGADLRVQVAGGIYYLLALDFGVGVDFDGKSWAPYLTCNLTTCSGGFGIFGGLGFAKTAIEKPREAYWAKGTEGQTWAVAILIGKSVRESEAGPHAEKVEAIGMGFGAWAIPDPENVTATEYRGVGLRVPSLRIPTGGNWHWFRALRSAHRVTNALRKLRAEKALRNLRQLNYHLAAFESSLGTRRMERMKTSDLSSVEAVLASHPLASAANLFRPQTLIDSEQGVGVRVVQACARALGLYGSKSQGFEPKY